MRTGFSEKLTRGFRIKSFLKAFLKKFNKVEKQFSEYQFIFS